MEKIEWNDIQGLVLSGYPMLPASAYLLWRFLPDTPAAAKQWLGSLTERLTSADASTETQSFNGIGRNLKALKQPGSGDLSAINLALTVTGLRYLRLDNQLLGNFSLEFQEGMSPEPATPSDTPRRSNLLGDIGASSPEHWDWGGWTKNRRIDGMLLLYAANDKALKGLVESEIAAMAGVAEPILQPTSGTKSLPALKGQVYSDLKEHFGFTDGISQPMIEGSPKSNKMKENDKSARGRGAKNDKLSADERRIVFVKPGEFILGYLNERRVNAMDVAENSADNSYSQKLRRNGTYLVFRQLEQDVQAFNDFVAEAAEHIYGDAGREARERFAALLVGRTLDGTPLVRSNPSSQSMQNDFLYYYEDRSGMTCPIGAHIRRANPRDTAGPDPDTSLRLSKMHRIIRRGRPYGKKLNPSSSKPTDQDDTRGMLFIALNADIAGQFELIQHSWLNNTHFGGLYAGTDPLGHFECPADVIAIQNRPTNLYIERPRPFVKVRGGAYFFMPGIEAVRALAA